MHQLKKKKQKSRQKSKHDCSVFSVLFCFVVVASCFLFEYLSFVCCDFVCFFNKLALICNDRHFNNLEKTMAIKPWSFCCWSWAVIAWYLLIPCSAKALPLLQLKLLFLKNIYKKYCYWHTYLIISFFGIANVDVNRGIYRHIVIT